MIPFASQRGSGQDLATHLLNEHDNEYVELSELRGAIADDLHGAFAEWEAQARGMTKCRNYLYSLSINPDPAQGPMARDLYLDYIGRVEDALGLSGQPRAVVFHIKDDKRGEPREHCHVVWSRIDVQECRAIHMAFDHDKLMTVTRQFARDHGIELAPGYHNLEERQRQTYRQLSLYEKFQEDSAGISKEDRRAVVTELWQGRDDPASFVNALEYHGYILATGKRPYVLVDIYGHTNSLPKLIDDKAANTKAIREFLGSEYSEDNLPSVEDAQDSAARHHAALEDHARSQAQADKLDALRDGHRRQTEKLEADLAAAQQRRQQEQARTAQQQLGARAAMRSAYLTEIRETRIRREAAKPRGLAGFLAKASGYAAIRERIHKYHDSKRYAAYLAQRQDLWQRQYMERAELQRRHEMRRLDDERKRRALAQTQAREEKSLQTAQTRQQRIGARYGHDHLPALSLALKPPGRPAAPYKAKNRYTSPLAQELRGARGQASLPRKPDLREDFQRATGADKNSQRRGEDSSSNAGPPPPSFEPGTRELKRKDGSSRPGSGLEGDRGAEGRSNHRTLDQGGAKGRAR